MVRAPVLAAGGIVLRQRETPLIAVVRLRKRNEWVLPKGKLDRGETPRDAAAREVLEETGHDVSVHEFLGTLVYESGGRFKVVHYWRMEANGGPSHALMDDVRAVDWLPLEAAVERLSHAYERAFLANVGPLALEAAELARFARQPRPKKQPPPEKRRRRPAVAPPRLPAPPIPIAPPPDVASPAIAQDMPQRVGVVEAKASDRSMVCAMAMPVAEEIAAVAAVEPSPGKPAAPGPARSQPINLVQKVRDWLRRAA